MTYVSSEKKLENYFMIYIILDIFHSLADIKKGINKINCYTFFQHT